MTNRDTRSSVDFHPIQYLPTIMSQTIYPCEIFPTHIVYQSGTRVGQSVQFQLDQSAGCTDDNTSQSTVNYAFYMLCIVLITIHFKTEVFIWMIFLYLSYFGPLHPLYDIIPKERNYSDMKSAVCRKYFMVTQKVTTNPSQEGKYQKTLFKN